MLRRVSPIVFLCVFSTGLAAPKEKKPEPPKGSLVVNGPSLHPILDGEFIYFIRSGDVRELVQRVPRAGGPAVTLARLKDSRLRPVVHGGFVYFAWDSELSRVPVTGGEAEVLLSSAGPIEQLAVDESGVYFRDESGLNHFNPSTKKTSVLVKAAALVETPMGEMVLDADGVLFVAGGILKGAPTHLKRVAKTGGPITTIATFPNDDVMHLKLRGDELYWSNQKAIRRLAKKGGEPVNIYRAQHGARVDLEDVHAGDIFFSEDGRGVFRMPLTGGEPTLLSERGIEVLADVQGIYVEEALPDGAFRLVKLPR